MVRVGAIAMVKGGVDLALGRSWLKSKILGSLPHSKATVRSTSWSQAIEVLKMKKQVALGSIVVVIKDHRIAATVVDVLATTNLEVVNLKPEFKFKPGEGSTNELLNFASGSMLGQVFVMDFDQISSAS